MNLFKLADRFRGSYSNSLGSAVCPGYCSYSGYHDELMWGLAWIYRASQDDSYMSYIERNCVRFGLTNHDFFFNWDDKRAGTNVLLAINYLGNQVADFQVYKDSSDIYICSMIKETTFATAQFTPGGLLYTQDGSNLQYVTTSSFLLLMYAKYLGADGMINSCGNSLISGAVLETHAKKQIDYILCDNPMNMSYMVGFGENYPTRIHHRGSSVPSIYDHPGRISCDDGQQYLTSLPPNPNLLVGAIVGGPDIDDNYEDSRNNSWQAKPATYINAPFVGVAAYLTIYTPK